MFCILDIHILLLKNNSMRLLIFLVLQFFLTGCATILHYENYKLDSSQSSESAQVCSSGPHYGDLLLTAQGLKVEVQNFEVTDWVGIPFIPLIPVTNFSKASHPTSLRIAYSLPAPEKLSEIKWSLSLDKETWVSGIPTKMSTCYDDRCFKEVEFKLDSPQQGLPHRLFVQLTLSNQTQIFLFNLNKTDKDYYPLALGEHLGGWIHFERHFCK